MIKPKRIKEDGNEGEYENDKSVYGKAPNIGKKHD